MTEALTVVYAGNWREVVATFTAPEHEPTAESTAVEFTLTEPDGTQTVATSPNVDIDGPDVTVAAGLTSTTWTWRTPVFDQEHRHFVVAKSTAGIIAAFEELFLVRLVHD